jgi:hypothetical protein
MPHTVESTIIYSAADYARGAVDLIEEPTTAAPPLVFNSSVVQKAISIVKEAAPQIMETIVSQLVPVIPQHSVGTLNDTVVPELIVSPPVETVVVLTVPGNSSTPVPIAPTDTVID